MKPDSFSGGSSVHSVKKFSGHYLAIINHLTAHNAHIRYTGADSVLFGSDGPGFTALVPNEEFIQILRDLPRKAPAGVKFTQEEIDCILGKNAQKVFCLQST